MFLSACSLWKQFWENITALSANTAFTHTHTENVFQMYLFLFTCLISCSSSEGAIGTVPRGLEEGASGACHQERGFGAGPVIRGVHYHGRRADLPGLSLRVSWGLVRALAPKVRKPLAGEKESTLSLEHSVKLWPCGQTDCRFFSTTEVSQSGALNLYQLATGVRLCIWVRLCVLSNFSSEQGRHKKLTQTLEMNKLLAL